MTTFIPPAGRPLPIAVVRKAVRALPLLGLLMAVTAQAASPNTEAQRRAAAPRQPQATRAIVDHAVQPAGGICHQCGPAGCKHGHHRECRDGACVPYCPVRPSTFGFYGTQWRRWPGSGVVQASNEQAAAPVKPPKSSVPGPDEESLGPKPSELPEPDFPAGDAPAAGPRSAVPPEPEAPEPTVPSTEAAAPAPEREADTTPVQPEPEAAPAKPRPQDENLFDESAAKRVRRKIPITAGQSPAASRVQPAAHQEGVSRDEAAAVRRPAPKTVPRVAFDPRKDAERMRQPVR